MARTRTYHHFCPVARSLEVIGEKWSLLIVRDLLRGPQRFTDLLRYLGGITPKWLTLRLRDLEQAGIVERDHVEGRREVWYRLTPKGRDLAPVIEALTVWGVDHALRPPLPGEPVHAERAMQTITTFRNRRGIRLPRPATWVIRFAGTGVYSLHYDGNRWFYEHGEATPDVLIEATPETWVNFLLAEREERRRLADHFTIDGDPEHVRAFFESYGIRTQGPHSPMRTDD
ncbi:MAG: winged helix-turn-helix transcriptional regulator [Dehalococcoidia bacterium]